VVTPAAWVRELAGLTRGAVVGDPASLERCASDFSRLRRRAPAAVLRPATVDDVVAALRFANEHAIPTAIRGAGHSQSGQTLVDGGLVLEMRSLNQVGSLREDERSIDVEAGATWSEVASSSLGRGLAPAVLTSEHATSVGGTLGVGGIGSTSWRFGAQIDNVRELDVVTGAGELVRCTREVETQLFDAVLGGLGQCGVVVRASLELREVLPRLRTFSFIYQDASAFLSDLRALMQEGRATHLLAHFRDSRSQRGRREIHLTVGLEYAPASEPDAADLAAGLHFSEALAPSDTATFGENHIFYFKYEDWFGPLEGCSFPWVDHFFVWNQALELLDAIVSGEFSPILALGVQTLIPVAAPVRPAPLLRPAREPEGEPLLLVGIFPKVAAPLGTIVAPLMDAYADAVEARYGAKRYVYGFRGAATERAWAAHYADRWDWFASMKRRYDPASILSPDAIRWH